ncbi:hypothetical protein Taro_042482 [Colocasia esculenta]|uniref:Uncharacterized protein n=1 Tax=Colocasia esculenta TaxID=4460 RepID=A0A843X2P8_COLES|nr:hypothetical protein [Colocasia esculenta]
MPVRGLWSSPEKIPNTLSVQWYHMESNGLATIKTEHSGQGCVPREIIYLFWHKLWMGGALFTNIRWAANDSGAKMFCTRENKGLPSVADDMT